MELFSPVLPAYATIRVTDMSTSQKKVILRRFSGDGLPGYLPASGFVHGKDLTLLDLSGRVTEIPLREIKSVFFVRDFNLGDAVNPERMQRKSFLARPRVEGLWLRLVFRESGEMLEGLAPLDASLLDDLTQDAGLQIAPPDTRSNTQRIYIPRLAIASLELLAVVTSRSRRVRVLPSKARASVAAEMQERLFAGAPRQEPVEDLDGRS